jgi:hypothetical protein
MTEQQNPPEADDTTSDDATEGRPAQTVRVPNVSPGAKSGLDHTVIGSDALAGAGEQDEEPDTEDDGDDPDVPQGDLDAAVAWVKDAEDSDDTKARADRVWKVYANGEGSNDGTVAAALQVAVYGDPTDGDPQTEQTGTGDPEQTGGGDDGDPKDPVTPGADET